MADQPGPDNPYAVRVRPRKAMIRGVPIEAPLPTLADQGMSMDADGTIRDNDGKPLIRVTTMPDLPPGVVVVASPVQPDEVLPGETVAEAMVRLRRAVVLHTTPAGEGSEASRD